jgi:hypothetical protein
MSFQPDRSEIKRPFRWAPHAGRYRGGFATLMRKSGSFRCSSPALCVPRYPLRLPIQKLDLMSRLESHNAPMRGSTLLLAASLTANVALVVLVAIRAPDLLLLKGASISAPSAVPDSVLAKTDDVTTKQRSVEFLFGGDVKTVVARLKAAGLPYNLVRAVAQAKIDELFLERRRKVAAKMKPSSYWKADSNRIAPEVQKELNSINKDQNRIMGELFSPDEFIDSDPVITAFSQMNSGGLSRASVDRLQKIDSDYSDLKDEVYTAAKGTLLPEDFEKLAFLQKERDADMAKALTPEQYLDYQLHNSSTAAMLRDSLQAFHPSEDEFRAIYSAQRDFEAQYGSPDVPSSSEQQALRQAHEGDLQEKIQETLGPDRYAEYKTETDPAYVAVDRIVERFDIPAAATQQVLSLQTDYSKQADDIRNDATLSSTDRESKLATLADEASSKLGDVLGARGLAAYRQNAGGWLQALKPASK